MTTRTSILLCGVVLILMGSALAQSASGKARAAHTVSTSQASDPAQDKDKANGTVSYLGVFVRDLSPEQAAALKVNQDNGAEITMVDRDGPAGKAGLKDHDVIVSVNGAPVQGAE